MTTTSTGMVDGIGSHGYAYDQLSRLTQESQYFNDLGAAYALTYQYNLAGELTSVTNPWSAQVSYNHDKLGRVTSVSGANYAGVASYINGIAYRAFGAAKQITYGNGKTLSLAYDNRQRLSQWNVAGVLGYNYAYNNFNENSGRVNFASNITNGVGGRDATLDRAYDYDHVGRLSLAFAGSEARAFIGTDTWGHPDGPYAQGFNYDVWGNTTNRYGWGGWNASYTTSFNSRNQRVDVGYDAAGNLVNDGGQYTYDATGQQTNATYPPDWNGYTLQQSYDGDSKRVKKVDNGDTTYYLRSSALGGQVICEIKNWGYGWSWWRGYVYLGGQLLALQAGGVYWVHQDHTERPDTCDPAKSYMPGRGGREAETWNQTEVQALGGLSRRIPHFPALLHFRALLAEGTIKRSDRHNMEQCSPTRNGNPLSSRFESAQREIAGRVKQVVKLAGDTYGIHE